MIRLRWIRNGSGKNKIDKWINHFISVTWSGSDVQCSRQLSFSLPHNPYDSSFSNTNIALADLIYMYDDSNLIFVGFCTSREISAAVGEANYIANDFMFHFTKSNASYKFKNITAGQAIRRVCKNMGVGITGVPNYKLNVKKMFFDNENVYDIIIAIMRKVSKSTGKKYLPVMNKNKFDIIEKGRDCGVKLVQGETVTDATYSVNFNDMVDRVYIYDNKGKCIGKVQNKSNLDKYGVFQDVYTKETGVSASKGAKEMLKGVNKEACISAIGNIKAISGRSIQIKDKATSLVGKFYITNDSHTFENGVHLMELQLAFNNYMEDGAEYENEKGQKGDNGVVKKKLSNNATCFHSTSKSFVSYHSTTQCVYLQGKKSVRSTVAKMKAVKYKKGKNKGKCKLHPCSKCWF